MITLTIIHIINTMQYKYCCVYQHVNLRTARENGIEKSRSRFSIFVSLHRSHVLPCEDGKTILSAHAALPV